MLKVKCNVIRTKIFVVGFLVLCCLCSPVWGKVYIDIDSPAFQKFPIAIQNFKGLAGGQTRPGLSPWFANELGDALRITGFFRVIERSAFIEDPSRTGITAQDINFGDWLSIGGDFLVKGGFHYNGTELTVEFRLFDVVEGKLIAGKKYWGKLEDRKTMVMKFAGEILLVLTGERGVFDSKIAFAARKGKATEIFTVNFDGSDFNRVTRYNSLTLLPRWSPDGKKLFFTSYVANNPDSYILDINSKKRSTVTNFTGLNMASSWSSDGKKVLIVLSKDGNEEIYEMTLKTKRLKRLTTDPAIDVSPSWSPDGSKIAFVSNRSGSPQIFIMDSDGKNVRRLTYEGSYNTTPQWSPRGGRIVYEGATDGHFQLFTIDEDGQNFLQVTFEDGGCKAPSWSPDGRYLAFTSMRGGVKKICIINSNGLNLRPFNLISGFDALKNLSWSPRLNLY